MAILMGKQALQAFISEKKREARTAAAADWQEIKFHWLDNLERLLQNIENWLQDLDNEDAINIEYEDVLLNEEHLGAYKAKRMIISIADEQVLLDPVGTMLIGAKGRVDMKGKNGHVKFVLVPEKSNGPAIKIAALREDRQAAADCKPVVWKIATHPPVVQYLELDADTFSDALLEVIGE